MSASTVTSTTTSEEWQGPVLDVVKELVADHEHGRKLITIFQKLVARNGELELQLQEMLSRRHKGEGVTTAQLMLLLEGLGHTAKSDDEPQPELAPCSPEAEQANEELRTAAGFGDGCGGQAPAATKPPPQPSVRKPFPEQLDRVEQIIAVPDEQRPCPVCGKPRDCIGHDTTETAELEPAKIIIRVEKREKLACHGCEASVVRAPIGDRVVVGGRFGSAIGRANPCRQVR